MRPVIFTDLDGTLLDHQTYSYEAARPALDLIARHCLPLILASSKTAVEIRALQRELGISAPAIVENGAGVLWPDDETTPSQDIAEIRAALATAPSDLRRFFEGFGDMTSSRIAAITGLSEKQAIEAAARQFSEPGLWSGDAQALNDFQTYLSTQGFQTLQGGRFLTISKGATKATHMLAVLQATGADVSVALGDAPNDREMLEAADFAIIIQNNHGACLPVLEGEREGRILRSSHAGPMGWNLEVLRLLRQLGYV